MNKLPYNENLFHAALKKNGFHIRQIKGIPVYNAFYNGNKSLLFDIAVETTSFSAGWVASDKVLTKILLTRAGIPVPEGKYFLGMQKKEAVQYAVSLGFPVVLKPAVGQHGDDVFSNIETEEELALCLGYITRHIGDHAYVLIEQYVPGHEYRLFVTSDRGFACVQRSPPIVSGDGKHTIIQLIQIENYKRTHPRNTCLCEIKLDDILFMSLEKIGLTIDKILPKGKTIELRKSTNVSKGGWCSELTTRVHPSNKAFAQRVLTAIPGLTVAGIDVICQDISKPLSTQSYVVCELNVSPGLSMHVVPPEGKPIDVANLVAKQLL